MDFPTAIDVRIPRSDAQLIVAGLKHLICRFQSWKLYGTLIDFHDGVQFPTMGFDPGESDNALIDKLFSIYKSVATNDHAWKRLSVDAFDLAACIVGVRVALTQVRHGHKDRHIDGNLTDLNKAAGRLMRRLEILRKRAKRSYIRNYGQAGFSEASRKWKRFVRWLRLHFLYCKCGRPKYGKGIWKICLERRRENMRKRLGIIRERLVHREIPSPSDCELERILRNAERSTDRLEQKLAHLDRDEREEELGRHLWNRIIMRCREAAEKAGRRAA